MSALNAMLGVPDPRELQLVRSLLEKTRLGKIQWARRANAIVGIVPASLEMNFVLSTSLLGTSSSWELFTARDVQGNTLLRIANPGFALNLAGKDSSALVGTVNELFSVVYGAVGDDLDRAIRTIEKL